MMNEQMKLRMLIITALFAAIIGVLAQVSIPIPPVPITGPTFAIGLAATILGAKYGTMSVLLYLMIGATSVHLYLHKCPEVLLCLLVLPVDFYSALFLVLL